MEQNTLSLETQAKKRADDKIDFLSHLVVYILVNSFLFGLNYISSPGNWWFQWALFGWGIGLVLHGVSVFILEGAFDGLRKNIYKSELERLKNKQ